MPRYIRNASRMLIVALAATFFSGCASRPVLRFEADPLVYSFPGFDSHSDELQTPESPQRTSEARVETMVASNLR